MKFTDGFFTFPVRVYDTFSVEKARKNEDMIDEATPAEWVRGKADVPLNEIKGVFDYFSRGRSVEEVEKDGFDGCLVATNSLGEFISTWDREKFKAQLNAFATKYQETLEEFVAEQMRKKEEALRSEIQTVIQQEIDIIEEEEEANQPKRGWFSSWFKK